MCTKILFVFLNKIFTLWVGGVVEKTSPTLILKFAGMKLEQKVPWHGNI